MALRRGWLVLVATCVLYYRPAVGLTAAELQVLRARGDLTVTESGDYYVLTSNGLPDHETGDFPNEDNPNTIREQSLELYVSKAPSVQGEDSCLPMGPIALAINGVAIYNPYTAEGNNAVEGEDRETFDQCDGHPDPSGRYHYHQTPGCILADMDQPDQFIAVAADGFPVYNNRDAAGSVLTSSDLDRCHGRTVDGAYRYHVTADFPYVLGCFRGSLHPSMSNTRGECRFATDNGAVPMATVSMATTALSMLLAAYVV